MLEQSSVAPSASTRARRAVIAVVALVAALGFGGAVFAKLAALSSTQTELAPGDTVAVFGPETFVSSSGSAQLFVERFGLTPEVGNRYFLKVENGLSDGTKRVTGGSVYLNGSLILSSATLAAGGAGWIRDVQILPEDTLKVTVQGGAGAQLTVSVLTTLDASFTVFETERFVRFTGAPTAYTRSFTLPASAGPPYRLCLTNGNPNGTNRITSANIKINGTTVVSSSDFSNQVGSLSREVTLQNPPSSNTVEVLLASQPQSFIDLCIMATDIGDPLLTITAPPVDYVTADSTVTLSGTIIDNTATVVTVNGSPATLGGDSTWTITLPLVEGANEFAISAVDAAGNQTDSSRTVRRDNTAPTVTITAPPADFTTADSVITLAGTATDDSDFTLNVNGTPIAVDSLGNWSTTVAVPNIVNAYVVTATDIVGNVGTAVRFVGRDVEAPTLTVISPTEGDTVDAPSVAVVGTVIDSSAVSVTVNGDMVPVVNGNFEQMVPLLVGSNAIIVTATDAFGNDTTITRNIVRPAAGPTLPPDPADVADAVDSTVVTNMFSSMEFLWTGTDPIQTGVAPGTIVPTRVAILQGAVYDHNDQPVTDASVRILNQPQFGQTRTRADGRYEIALNGGGQVTVEISKDGYLTLQRTLEASWQQFTGVDSVVMTPLDTAVTVIDFQDSIEVARGTPVTDAAGTRQATLMFKQGTTAAMVLPNGSTQPLTSLSIRATEYTVGDKGPAAMPGNLPVATAYTYAAELSVDEAVAASARTVNFSQPVVFYVENFLAMPRGAIVPVGTYDRTAGAWRADQDGRVIEIVGNSGGVAQVSVTSSATPASQAVLDSLGFNTAELQQLAALYPVGTQLWRSQHTSFSPKDWNFLYRLARFSNPAHVDFLRFGALFDCNGCNASGSIIGTQNATLGEAIGIAGTPLALHYSSDRSAGYRSEYRVTIPAQIRTDTATYAAGNVRQRNQFPSHMVYARYVLEVAGRRIVKGPFPGNANIPETTLEWDGLDVAGRRVMGRQKARVTIEFAYPNLYAVGMGTGGASGTSFGLGAGANTVTTNTPARMPLPIEQVWDGALGVHDARAQGIGGWTLSAHHALDPNSFTLYHGDGSRREANVIGQAVVPHSSSFIPNDAVVAPDGQLYMTFGGSGGIVQRVSADGQTVVVVAGISGQTGYSGEGLIATASRLSSNPQGVAIGPDGLLYIADASNNRIRRVDADGRLRTIIGNGSATTTGNGGLAINATTQNPQQLAFLPDGSLLFTEGCCSHVRRIAPNGIVTRFAGTGTGAGNSGNGGPATSAAIGNSPMLTTDGSGNAYIAYEIFIQPNNQRSWVIRKIRPDGIIEAFAGRSVNVPPNTTPALAARLVDVKDIARGSHDAVIFTSGVQVLEATQEGQLNLVAGSSPRCFFLTQATVCDPVQPMTRALARQFKFAVPTELTSYPDGRIFIGDSHDARRRIITTAMPGFDANALLVASEDGSVMYQFDQYGKHLRTIDAMSRDTVLTFGYNAGGWLTSVTDADGEVTTIERTGATVTAIVGPDGHRTELGYDATGYLDEVVNPNGERVQLATASNGLLQSMTDPRGGVYAFRYDTLGRLVSDSSAANRVQTLSRTETDTSSTSVLSDDLGRSTTYRLDRLGPQRTRRTVTDAAGLVTVSNTFANDSTVTVTPDGTSMMSVSGSDPRFGAQSPVLRQARTVLPSGLTSVVTASRTPTLSNANDPLSLTTLLDSVRVNNRLYRNLYTRSTRTLVTTSPMGRTTTTVYDAAGRVLSSTVPGITPATFQYDARGRLQQAQSGGRVSTFAYDAKGRLLSTTDPLGRKDSLFYDNADRLTRRVLPDGRQVTFAYDSAGNLTSVTPPGKPAHTFTYAPADRLAIYNPPTNGLPTSATSYHYNTAGQVKAIRRPTGDSISFGYDLSGRPASVTFQRSGAPATIGFNFHPTTGNLTSLSGPGGTGLAFTYDGSLPTSVTWSGAVSGSTAVTYNTDFRVVGQTVNGAHAVSFGYDNDGLLTQAGALGLRRAATNGRLDADSLIVGGATQKTGYGYDAHGALSAMASTRASDTLLATGYTRDSLSRITQLVERIQGVTQTIAFTYDSVGRLSTVTRNGVLSASYTYDLNGNRATKTTSGGTATAVVDDQDRLVSYGGATYAYTAHGDLSMKVVGNDTTTYDYDALGNLIEVRLPDGTEIGYLIDPQNRRIGRTVNGVLERAWLYQGQLTPVAELDGSGNVVSRFVYATGVNVPDYLVRGDSTYRLVRDHLGSVRLVVNVATGTVAQRIDYDEFGVETANTNPAWQPFGYAGGLTDSQTGLVRFGARDYDPVAGRWAAKDPILFGGGATSLYNYSLSDPINYRDFDGREVTLAEVGNAFGQFMVGFGDAVSLGLTRRLRESRFYGGDCFTDYGSTAYFGGKIAGYGTLAATAGAASLSGGAASVFFSGPGSYEAAIAARAGVTIMQTLGGRILHAVGASDLAWKVASAIFALNARGVATVFERLPLREGATWLAVELPILLARGIPIVYR